MMPAKFRERCEGCVFEHRARAPCKKCRDAHYRPSPSHYRKTPTPRHQRGII